MEYDVAYDDACECYVWWYEGNVLCLSALNMVEAQEEVEDLASRDIYPESWLPEGEEEVEYYDDALDGDMASALASVGWGTDEDYGHYGSDE